MYSTISKQIVNFLLNENLMLEEVFKWEEDHFEKMKSIICETT